MRCSIHPQIARIQKIHWRGIGRQTSTARVRRHSTQRPSGPTEAVRNQRMQYPIGSLPRHNWFQCERERILPPDRVRIDVICCHSRRLAVHPLVRTKPWQKPLPIIALPSFLLFSPLLLLLLLLYNNKKNKIMDFLTVLLFRNNNKQLEYLSGNYIMLSVTFTTAFPHI